MFGKEALKRMAEMAGVSEEQFLKVAGVLYLFERGFLMSPKAGPDEKRFESDLEKRFLHLLSIERVLSVRELTNLLNVEERELETVIQKLSAEGKVAVETVSNNKIVATTNDGTLNIASLKPEDRQWLIINAYGNRDKGLTYAQIFNFLRTAPNEKKKEGWREKILKALETGPKRFTELRRELNIPEGSLKAVLSRLLKEGRIERVEVGLYKLAGV